MTETTEGKSIPEALRMIAQWLEDGKKLECSTIDNRPQNQFGWVNSLNEYSPIRLDYRAKPEKPRRGILNFSNENRQIPAVEITPEVRACLEKEGLL